MACEQLKEEGNALYKEQKYDEAVVRYSQALGGEGEEHVKVTVQLNRAQCYLLLGKPQEAVRDTTRVLERDPGHIKALYRRSKAYAMLQQWNEAVHDMRACLQRDHTSALFTKELAALEVQRQSAADTFDVAAWKRDIEGGYNDLTKLQGALAKAAANRHTKAKQAQLLQHHALSHLLNLSMRDEYKETTRTAFASCLASLLNAIDDGAMQTLAQHDLESHLKLVRFMTTLLCSSPPSSLRKALESVALQLSSRTAFPVLRTAILETIYDHMVYAEQVDTTDTAVFHTVHRFFSGFCAQSHVLDGEKASEADTQLRSIFLQHLLSSPSLAVAERKEDILSSLLLVVGSPQQMGAQDPSSMDQYDKPKPTMDNDLVDRCHSLMQQPLFSNKPNMYLPALRALSALLQVSPQTGHELVNGDKVLQRLVELATMDAFGRAEIAAEVLALASSSTAVRQAIVEGSITDLFFDLLDFEEDLVRAHAGVALSKLAPAGPAVATRVLEKNCVLRAMMDIVQTVTVSSLVLNKVSQLAIEAISYLSIYIETKQALAMHENGTYIRLLSSLIEPNGRSIGFGILQIISNMCTSVDDIKRQYNSELEQLKKVASQSLKNNKEKQVVESRAGGIGDIAVIRRVVIDAEAVHAFSKAFKKKSPNVEAAIARTLLHLSSECEGDTHIVRGKLVQQGALRMLVELSTSSNEKCWKDCALAMARIGITTNPHSYPTGTLENMIGPLLRFVKDADHELFIYEAMLALTNIASVSDDARSCIFRHDGWDIIRSVLVEENPLLQRAAVQAQANMITCPQVLEKLHNPHATEDLCILLAFCSSDDKETVLAATGALAMASDYVEIARKLPQIDSFDNITELLLVQDKEITQRCEYILHNVKQLQ